MVPPLLAAGRQARMLLLIHHTLADASHVDICQLLPDLLAETKGNWEEEKKKKTLTTKKKKLQEKLLQNVLPLEAIANSSDKQGTELGCE